MAHTRPVDKHSILGLIELSYAPSANTGEWLARIGTQLARQVPGAVLPFGYIFQKQPGQTLHFEEAFMEGNPDALGWFREHNTNLDQAMQDAFFPTGTASSLFSERFALGRGSGSSTASEPVDDLIRSVDGDDSWATYCVDGAGRGVLCGAIARGISLSPRDRETHRRIAVHMASGLRLRSALSDAARAGGADAVLRPDGHVEDARGAAVEQRECLREAVARVERARGTHSEGRETLDLWQGLVEGRWSIVDYEDSDGKRYYLALANPPLAVLDRSLSVLEAQVAAHAVTGDSNKVIAYALGLAESTTANLLTCALRKLGLASRVDLIRVGVTLGIHGRPLVKLPCDRSRPAEAIP